MHSLVGYDRGRNNDFLLRAEMFRHWRELFFETIKKAKLFSKKRVDVAKEEEESRGERGERIYELR